MVAGNISLPLSLSLSEVDDGEEYAQGQLQKVDFTHKSL